MTRHTGPRTSVGDALCQHILEIEGIPRGRLASALGISRPWASDLMNDRRAVTAQLAVRLARLRKPNLDDLQKDC